MSKQKRPPSHKHLLRLQDPGRIAPPTGEAWPGVSDPSLLAPDAIKFDYANFAAHQAPGQPKLEQFEPRAPGVHSRNRSLGDGGVYLARSPRR
jgi:hypothetical protein